MESYLALMRHVLAHGERRSDRTETGTLSVFGYQLRYALSEGFPLLTTKKLHVRAIIHELLWFIRGDTDIRYLHEHNVRIWDAWVGEDKACGPLYGRQWRGWGGEVGEPEKEVDQLQGVIESIQQDPYSRRHIVSAWNVGDLEKMALYPCHVLFQFYVSSKGTLSCQVYQRSSDIFLGLPFNLASYALLTHMIAQLCGLQPGELVYTLGDAHLYCNHLTQARTQVERKPYALPRLELAKRSNINDFVFEDIGIVDYVAHPHIKADIAV